MRPFRLVLLILTLTSCAMGNRPEGIMPPAETVKSLEFTIASANLDQAFGKTERQQMAGHIAKNLSSWGYAVGAAGQAHVDNPTHTLEARVGKITHKSTPPGLSFTLGNADPRALEFQRADVVPITCALASRAKPKDAVTLTGDFVVEMGLDDLIGHQSVATPMDYYVDRIGTVCLNLLMELKVDRTKPQASAGEPTWIPQVRIEVRDKPDSQPHPTSVQPTAVQPTSAVPAKTAEPPSDSGIRTETTRKESDARKQVIIHNRGVPVILEFGHERK